MPAWCATTAPGLEPIAHADARTAGATPTELPFDGDGLVGVETAHLDDAEHLLNSLRTVNRVGPVLATDRVDPTDPFEALGAMVARVDWTPWIDERTRWALRCARHGEHPFTSVDVERRLGGALDDLLTRRRPSRPPVDLEDPDALVRLHLGDDGGAVLWLDLVGTTSLHRRGYRAYHHPASMKPTIAAALVQALDWDPTTRLVDPFAGSGTLAIEAAWHALGVSPVHGRSADLLIHRLPRWRGRAPLRGPGPHRDPVEPPDPWLHLLDHAPNHLEGARGNLHAAGLGDRATTTFATVNAFAEHVDHAGAVVANPPYGIRSGEGDLAPTYRALLAQSRKVLDPGDPIGILTARDDLVRDAADPLGLTVETSLAVQHGRLAIRLMVLR